MPIKNLYISDLDGTLLGPDGWLREECREGLHSLLSDGLHFTVASARSMFSIRQILRDLPIRLPIVNFNGAYLSDFATGRHTMVNAIEPTIAEEIYDLLGDPYDFVPFISTYDGTADRLYYNEVRNEGMQWYVSDRFANRDERWRKSDNLRAHLVDEVICLTIIDREEKLAPLAEELDETYGASVQVHILASMYSPGWYWLTVHAGAATKANAIAQLRQDYGLDDHRLVVFGDQSNDLPMFRIADHGVAVENAIDELKEQADTIIGPNTEGSVVRYLQDIVMRPR